MLSKEEIEKAKETMQQYIQDTPTLPYDCIANHEKEATILLLDYLEQLETDKKKLLEKLEADKMKQFDDYVIYLIESYLAILKGENKQSN